ncbi:hypothetical protein Tcan_05420 [Toxocara canis]|uniref:Uncharacterized protein n=2 Tax=Toxocara canis TaxID=6265 RepID=A0A0B2VQP2_TOXCA|nr:hypothetical protein Tcan_05420 [Toxocara canis]VDM42482.1 unnamed protein product [Toxocara canis]
MEVPSSLTNSVFYAGVSAEPTLSAEDVADSCIRKHRSGVLGRKFLSFLRNNLNAHFGLTHGNSLPTMHRSRSGLACSDCRAGTPSPIPSPRSASSSRAPRASPKMVLSQPITYRINAWNVSSEPTALVGPPKPNQYRYFRRFHRSPEYSRALIKLSNFAFFEERWKSFTDAFNAAYPFHKITVIDVSVSL